MFEQLSLLSLVERAPVLFTGEDVIKAEKIKPITWEAWVVTNNELSGGSDWDYKTNSYGRDKSIYQIYAFIALLPENAVYLCDFYLYPFLYHFENEKKANEFYDKKLEGIRSHRFQETARKQRIYVIPPIVDTHRINNTPKSFLEVYAKEEYALKVNKPIFQNPLKNKELGSVLTDEEFEDNKGEIIPFANLEKYIGERVIYETEGLGCIPVKKLIKITSFHKDCRKLYQKEGKIVCEYLKEMLADRDEYSFIGYGHQIGYTDDKNKEKENSWINELFSGEGRYKSSCSSSVHMYALA